MPPRARVPLNSASLESLVELPGVGPALARRIMAARPFHSVRDLILVNGVGPRLYSRLAPLLTADEPTPAGETQPTAPADETRAPAKAAAPRPEPEAAARSAVRPAEPEAPAARVAPPAEAEAPAPRVYPPVEPEAPAARVHPPAEPEAPAQAPLVELEAEAAAVPAPAEPAGRPRPTPYFPPISALPAPRRRRLVGVSVRTRWRILLALFYGLIVLALAGLALVIKAALGGVGQPAPPGAIPTAVGSAHALRAAQADGPGGPPGAFRPAPGRRPA